VFSFEALKVFQTFSVHTFLSKKGKERKEMKERERRINLSTACRFDVFCF
jgi:hypothetical protein